MEPAVSTELYLLHTDLDDFIEHANEALRFHMFSLFLPHDTDSENHVSVDDEDDNGDGVESWITKDGKFITRVLQDSALRAELTYGPLQRTVYVWHGYACDPTPDRENTIMGLIGSVDDEEAHRKLGQLTNLKWLFWVHATRFRTDRLRLDITEPKSAPMKTTDHIVSWLRRWWDDAVVPVSVKTAEVKRIPASIPALAPGRKRDAWNARAIERLLAGESKELVRADWWREYEAETGAPPDDKTWSKRVWQPYLRCTWG